MEQISFWHKDIDFGASVYLDEVNKRIRVDEYVGKMSSLLTYLTSQDGTKYEKLIIKSKQEDMKFLLSHGYMMEAMIDNYFNGSPAYFFVKYNTAERQHDPFWEEEEKIVQQVLDSEVKPIAKLMDLSINIRKAELSDSESLSNLYKKVFAIYPVPIHDPEYVKKSMMDGTIFYCAEKNGQLISAASAEINQFYHNAELTDCATDPDYRKGGLMKYILAALEEELRNKQIFCSYTIARSLSFGMNMAFYQLGYEYRGRLKNNCYIYDKLEDMNVWEKNLSTAGFSAGT
ncbi:putative beta-lysine N-acetyltransferase [Falsibacillus pallidus]|uniref:Beta-lysine acetyltransferase n=1 Tax=Falsibacillus pallidus TaxID=493781 RepID=A0A370GMG1_9BACI|nr:putative beta-lysine N-acetyltransferase [Falsibacillus pallidus]RDI43093.1 beta-lysine acetyltransferase [Falsibacillus pallidus]